MKTTLLFLSVFLSASLFGQTAGTGAIDIDGNYYESVIIGDQEWLTMNLKTSHFADGTPIPNVESPVDWESLTSPGWAFYDNDENNEMIYGKLYNWFTIESNQNICPAYWNVPSKEDWSILKSYLTVNGYDGAEAYGLLSTSGWDEGTGGTSVNWNGDDNFGFSALPGGARSNYGWYEYLGEIAHWWSRSPLNNPWDDSAFFQLIVSAIDLGQGMPVPSSYPRNYGMSIRCIKDESNQLSEILNVPKNLTKILDLMGRETTFKPNTPLIYVYDDGSIEKVFSVEY